jgi:hypothetical protein
MPRVRCTSYAARRVLHVRVLKGPLALLEFAFELDDAPLHSLSPAKAAGVQPPHCPRRCAMRSHAYEDTVSDCLPPLLEAASRGRGGAIAVDCSIVRAAAQIGEKWLPTQHLHSVPQGIECARDDRGLALTFPVGLLLGVGQRWRERTNGGGCGVGSVGVGQRWGEGPKLMCWRIGSGRLMRRVHR